ncbi:MAG TPA: molybdopterin-binding protein, partial [Acetobacteraceae bacterium]|nr:molybdopterin-binding protein [Acetobacteraceae bacterium]
MMPSSQRQSLDVAISWVDRAITGCSAERVPLVSAYSRILAEVVHAAQPIPPIDQAALDGFAVAASDTIGANPYNPLLLPLQTVPAGGAIPPGTDAVIPLDLGQPQPAGVVECVVALAPGENVEAQGAVAALGTTVVSPGTLLSAAHIGLLNSVGLASAMVVRRPLVRVIVTPASAAADSNGPMCSALVRRDGGVVVDVLAERSRPGIRSALETEGADIALVVGGSGPGTNDHAAAALAEAGNLAIHGIALMPGETTGLGCTRSGMPVVLLPGSPAACLFAYEMLAGRAVRCLGNRDRTLPYRTRMMRTARKIVSAIG